MTKQAHITLQSLSSELKDNILKKIICSFFWNEQPKKPFKKVLEEINIAKKIINKQLIRAMGHSC